MPEPVDETWARLRHLGARREQLLTEIGSQLQQMRDLLDCVWPAALDTARQPFRSRTWIAALAVIVGRDRGDLSRNTLISTHIMGSPARRRTKPITRCRDQPHSAMQGPTTGEAPTPPLTQNDSR